MNKLTQEAKIILGIGIGTVMLITAAIFLLSSTGSADAASDIALITKNATHRIESPTAKVTVTEFADFQCPACAMANPVLNQIKKEYEGRVSFMYRHFPLPQHKNARLAINAAEAAGDQNKFWEMSDLLYAKQLEWAESEDPKSLFEKYAQTLNLDLKNFIDDYASSKYDNQIQTDLKDAKSLSVNSTPTFYINNQKLTQSPSYQNLKSAIEKQLNN